MSSARMAESADATDLKSGHEDVKKIKKMDARVAE